MRRLLLLIGLALCLALPATAVASAQSYNPLSDACSTAKAAGKNAASSSACDKSVDGSDPITGPDGVLMKATLIISTIAGVAAVIIVLVGGIQFATSAGDAQKAANARNAIIGGLVGLAIVAAAGGILTFVISKV